MPDRAFLFLTLPILLGPIGCGSSTSLAPVKGKVTYRGQPLPGGVIVFTPDKSKGTHGPIAHAEIQNDGRFILKTGQAAGAVCGWHRVTVCTVDSSDAAGIQPANLLPERYCRPESSTLSYHVKPDGKNVFDIRLD